MSDHDDLRLAGWDLALYLGSDDEREMCDGTPVDLHHIPALMDRCAYALRRRRALHDSTLKTVAGLRKDLTKAEYERAAVSRALASALDRADALHRQLADERAVHLRTANDGQVEMLHAELSVAPRLALVRAGDAMAQDHTPETVAAWESVRGVECDE